MFKSALMTLALVAALGTFAGLRAGAETSTSQPATTHPGLPCCTDECTKMKDCCKADDKGKVTCSMGGACCKKTGDTKTDGDKTGSGNHNMGGMCGM